MHLRPQNKLLAAKRFQKIHLRASKAQTQFSLCFACDAICVFSPISAIHNTNDYLPATNDYKIPKAKIPHVLLATRNAFPSQNRRFLRKAGSKSPLMIAKIKDPKIMNFPAQRELPFQPNTSDFLTNIIKNRP